MRDVSWTNEQLRPLRFGLALNLMTARDQAIKAIEALPEDSGLDQIVREISFLGGVEKARREIARGEGMEASAAKEQLREWVAG